MTKGKCNWKKKEKQKYCYCLTLNQSEKGWVVLTAQGHQSIIKSDYSRIRKKLRIWNLYTLNNLKLRQN